MRLFKTFEHMGHEQVVFCHDKKTGLKAIIAIHNTILGPALGGCRMWNYNSEEDALHDVLRLSRGMTYKAALARLPLGGGKAVICGDPKTQKVEALLRSFGKFVDRLGGAYITAQDVSLTTVDLLHIKKETNNVVGLPAGRGGSGDPSPMTAFGVFNAIKASVKYRLKKESLQGVRIAVQGCGNVGVHLCRLLHEDGAKLWISDIDSQKVAPLVDSYGAQVVDNTQLLTADVDVLSPCALGGIFDENTIPQLKAKIIAGGANNQLVEEKHGDMLRERGILYAPDYIANAGGLISVSYEVEGYHPAETATEKTKGIYDTLLEIYQASEANSESTAKTANKLAEERISKHTSLAVNQPQKRTS